MDEIALDFIYNGCLTKVHCTRNEYMKDIFKKYLSKINKDINDVYFIYNGNKINEELKLEQINNKDNGIKILVNDINVNNNENKLNQFKDIICPECGDVCLLDIKDYKIMLNKCINKHNIENLLLDEFNDLQKNNYLNILCNNCKKNKSEVFKNKLYKCCNCKINICPLCKSKHNSEHTLIDYELKNYLCNVHGERFMFYCNECNINLCDLCELDHNKNHNYFSLNKLISKKENNTNELRIKIDKLKKEIKGIINKLNKIIDNLELYYNLNNNIINNYNIKNKNYEILINMNSIYNYNEIVIKDINEIINENENKIENKMKESDILLNQSEKIENLSKEKSKKSEKLSSRNNEIQKSQHNESKILSNKENNQIEKNESDIILQKSKNE
jgi:hypothetical protein